MFTQLLLSSTPSTTTGRMNELQQQPVMGKTFTPTNYTVVPGCEWKQTDEENVLS